MELLEDGLTGAVLGHYLHETRVKIIDTWLTQALELNDVPLVMVWSGFCLLSQQC